MFLFEFSKITKILFCISKVFWFLGEVCEKIGNKMFLQKTKIETKLIKK